MDCDCLLCVLRDIVAFNTQYVLIVPFYVACVALNEWIDFCKYVVDVTQFAIVFTRIVRNFGCSWSFAHCVLFFV